MPDIRIFQPARTAMQSGRGKTHQWMVQFKRAAPHVADPLMGWIRSSDNARRFAFCSIHARRRSPSPSGINCLMSCTNRKPKRFGPRAMQRTFGPNATREAGTRISATALVDPATSRRCGACQATWLPVVQNSRIGITFDDHGALWRHIHHPAINAAIFCHIVYRILSKRRRMSSLMAFGRRASKSRSVSVNDYLASWPVRWL